MGMFVPGGPAAWIGDAPETTAPGHVAVLCQSGSIADAFLSLGGRIGLRCVVSSGGEAVTDAADFLGFFAEDEGTRAVGLFLETVRRPAAFADALAACAAAGKPVVCLKVGRSEAAARAALSHTGALVGSVRAFSALLRRYGAIEVEDFHELVETLEILGRRRWPRGTRVAAVSESGGECALLADHAEAAGIPFEPLPPQLAAERCAPSSRTSSTPATRSTPGRWPTRASSTRARSSCWPSPAPTTSCSPRSTCRSSADVSERGLVRADVARARPPGRGAWRLPAGVTVHSADPPRRFQELARELDLPLLRGTRDAMRALAHVARWRPARASATEDGRARRRRPAAGPGAAARARVGARARALRRPVRAAPAGRVPGGSGRRGGRARLPGRRQGGRVAHKARAGGVVLGIGSPQEAADGGAPSRRPGARRPAARARAPRRSAG